MITGRNDDDHAIRQNGAVVDRGRPCMWIRDDAELTVITINGEIDASDIDNMSSYARRRVRDCGVLIIDLSGTQQTEEARRASRAATLALWGQNRDLHAVRDGHVYAGTSDVLVVPGPRTPLATQRLFDFVHGIGASD